MKRWGALILILVLTCTSFAGRAESPLADALSGGKRVNYTVNVYAGGLIDAAVNPTNDSFNEVFAKAIKLLVSQYQLKLALQHDAAGDYAALTLVNGMDTLASLITQTKDNTIYLAGSLVGDVVYAFPKDQWEMLVRGAVMALGQQLNVDKTLTGKLADVLSTDLYSLFEGSVTKRGIENAVSGSLPNTLSLLSADLTPVYEARGIEAAIDVPDAYIRRDYRFTPEQTKALLGSLLNEITPLVQSTSFASTALPMIEKVSAFVNGNTALSSDIKLWLDSRDNILSASAEANGAWNGEAHTLSMTAAKPKTASEPTIVVRMDDDLLSVIWSASGYDTPTTQSAAPSDDGWLSALEGKYEQSSAAKTEASTPSAHSSDNWLGGIEGKYGDSAVESASARQEGVVQTVNAELRFQPAIGNPFSIQFNHSLTASLNITGKTSIGIFQAGETFLSVKTSLSVKDASDTLDTANAVAFTSTDADEALAQILSKGIANAANGIVEHYMNSINMRWN